MNKIATHDSATGERPANFISWLIIPFARTQSKTIKEQYEAGCRSFDIRVRMYKGVWHCAHGLFVTKRTALDILAEIASFPERCLVQLTYEGGVDEPDTLLDFSDFAEYLRHRFAHIIWGAAFVKYGKSSKGVNVAYDTIINPQGLYEGGAQGFLPLDGRSIHTYLPIPWLWNKIYTTPHKFNEYNYTFVDFL